MLVNFKAALTARGIRQVDLAIKIKKTPGWMSDVISQRRVPEPCVRTQIAELLDAKEEWLFSTRFRIPRHNAQGASDSTSAVAALSCAPEVS